MGDNELPHYSPRDMESLSAIFASGRDIYATN